MPVGRRTRGSVYRRRVHRTRTLRPDHHPATGPPGTARTSPHRRGVTHVIVYELSRLARNRADDIHIVTELTAHDVTLVSASENVDATPVGQLTHGLLAAVNEYRSARDGADIAYKMGEKAKRGGTLGRAPIGYTNTLERRDGHDSRSIHIDPVRGPLIQQAFELFATDQYGYDQLADLMLERGLSRKSRPASTPRSIGKTGIARLLTSRCYLGLVTHAGTERPGQHQPLVDQRLFGNVQAVIERRRASGLRRRKLYHYLKGTLYCETCFRKRNRTRVLSYTETSGRRGRRFFYFYCAERGRTRHTMYIPASRTEDHVMQIWKELRLTSSYRSLLQHSLAQDEVHLSSNRPGSLYRTLSVACRRMMNQVIFDRIYLPDQVAQYA